jgi:16S rRNA processing protein RimM
MTESWIDIGTVRSANPARRELRVRVAPGRAHQFEGMSRVDLRFQDASHKHFRVAQVRVNPDGVILALAPGVPRDSVAGLKGASVVIPADERRPGPDGMWAPDDLLGLRVVDEQETCIGVVSTVMPTPAHSVIEIDREEGGPLLLPAIKQVILGVDLNSGTLTVGDTRPYGVESGAPDK